MRKLPYWLIGGIIGVIVYFVVFWLTKTTPFPLVLNIIGFFFAAILFRIFAPSALNGFPYRGDFNFLPYLITSIIINTLFFFFLGASIGHFIFKIKNRK